MHHKQALSLLRKSMHQRTKLEVQDLIPSKVDFQLSQYSFHQQRYSFQFKNQNLNSLILIVSFNRINIQKKALVAFDFYLVIAMNMQTELFGYTRVFQDFACTCSAYGVDIACCFQVTFASLNISILFENFIFYLSTIKIYLNFN